MAFVEGVIAQGRQKCPERQSSGMLRSGSDFTQFRMQGRCNP